jgi:fructose-1-phosphate kinase PfkB-like protein
LVLGENYNEAVMLAAATGTAATLINDVSITQESVDAILAQVKVRRAT